LFIYTISKLVFFEGDVKSLLPTKFRFNSGKYKLFIGLAKFSSRVDISADVIILAFLVGAAGRARTISGAVTIKGEGNVGYFFKSSVRTG